MIEISDLSVKFGSTDVVDSFDFLVDEGKTAVIIGESGSGKSVTLSAILRILPPEANVLGSIKLDGLELMSLSENEFNKIRGVKLAYVPQGSGHSLNPLLKIGFQVAEPIIEHHKIDKKAAIRQAIDLMRRLNLGDEEKVANSFPHTLSGGMKQRVLIAMGIASEAPVVLADEPTKGLDQKRILIIEELFSKMKGSTILCVSHDLRFAAKIADKICVMYSGQKVEEADAVEFFANPFHPYSKMLMDALPENGMKTSYKYSSSNDIQQMGCRFYSICEQKDKVCEKPPPVVHIGSRKVRCFRYVDTS